MESDAFGCGISQTVKGEFNEMLGAAIAGSSRYVRMECNSIQQEDSDTRHHSGSHPYRFRPRSVYN